MEINRINRCENLYTQNYVSNKSRINFGATNPIEDTFERQKVEQTEKEVFDFAKVIKKTKEFAIKLFCVDKAPEAAKENYIKSVYSDVVKEIGIPKELQPELYIKPFKDEKDFVGGFFQQETHSIFINTNN